jgi:ABC-type transporter Mla subunit MlaD
MSSARGVPRLAACLGATLLFGLAAGCGSSSSSTSSSAAFCSGVKQLETSITSLSSTNVVQAGTTTLKSDLNNIAAQANALAGTAKSTFQPQVKALQDALSKLKTTVGQLQSSSTRVTALTEVAADAQGVETAFTNLTTAVKSECK